MGPGKGGQFWWGKDKHGNRRRDNPPGARPGPGAAAGPAAAYGTSRREDKAAAARGKEEAAAEGRARGKRKAPKRCRGMCFQAPPPPPALAVADKASRAEAKKARLRERKRERAEAAAAARAAEAPPGAGAEPAGQRAKRAKIPDGVEVSGSRTPAGDAAALPCQPDRPADALAAAAVGRRFAPASSSRPGPSG